MGGSGCCWRQDKDEYGTAGVVLLLVVDVQQLLPTMLPWWAPKVEGSCRSGSRWQLLSPLRWRRAMLGDVVVGSKAAQGGDGQK